MANPRVSVIIPAFNAEATLSETVSSVLAQTSGNLECLVIDDGSSDSTLAVAVQMATGDCRVRVLRHPDGVNKGVASSRNLGIEESRGQFLAFLDADDAWLPAKLERQLEILDQLHEVGLVFSDVYTSLNPDPAQPMKLQPLKTEEFRGSMAILFNSDDQAALRTLTLHPDQTRLIPSATPLMRRELLEDGLRFFGPPDLRIQYEDYLMWRILSARTRFHCLQEPLAIYRVHGSSFTGRFPGSHSVVDHMHGLEDVHRIFLAHCAENLDAVTIKAMTDRRREGFLRRVHRVAWSDLPEYFRMARNYEVGGEVLRRRVRVGITTLRTKLSRARGCFRRRGDRYS